jgi:hypothetical protein
MASHRASVTGCQWNSVCIRSHKQVRAVFAYGVTSVGMCTNLHMYDQCFAYGVTSKCEQQLPTQHSNKKAWQTHKAAGAAAGSQQQQRSVWFVHVAAMTLLGALWTALLVTWNSSSSWQQGGHQDMQCCQQLLLERLHNRGGGRGCYT